MNDVFERVLPPKGANVMASKFVYKTKRDATGKVARYKVRFTAKGSTQKAGIDFDETYAPVARSKTVLTVFALAAYKNWELHQMDVLTAFLHADIGDKVVYIKMPEGYKKYDSNGKELVWKLKKSLYGLKQAPRNWNTMIDKWLKAYGLKASSADHCLYTKIVNGEHLVIILYVDDLLIAGSDMKIINEFKAAISEVFKMKDLGEVEHMLGMVVKRDRENGTLEVDQTAYIEQVLSRYGMAQCKPMATPMTDPLTRGPPNEDGFNYDYARIVGSVLYSSMYTRPEITYAVQSLSRNMNATTSEHWQAAKRLLRYLQGTKHLGIKFGGDKSQDLKLVGYSDADWANDKDTRRSTTGYAFLLNGAVISWCSKLQTTVALSSTEAEYMALCAAAQEAVHLRRLLSDLGFEQKGPTIIYEDNQSCIALAKNPVHHARTKHIDIRFHYTREKIEDGEIDVVYVPTSEQLADVLTKPLERVKLEALRKKLLGY